MLLLELLYLSMVSALHGLAALDDQANGFRLDTSVFVSV